jgi:hypothetical protein
MENTNGRGGSFLSGANGGVRLDPEGFSEDSAEGGAEEGGSHQAEFHTSQQGLPEGFHLSSVLDKNQVLRPANGTSQSDRARQTIGGHARNLNGQSQQTFDDQMWTGGVGRTLT